MITTLELKDGDMITLAGWLYPAKVRTVRGSAAQYRQDPDAEEARAIERGDDLVWSRRAPAILDTTGDADRERRADLARAITVKGGERVVVEGRAYILKVNGPRYSDPFSFWAE